jgi:hypothetical protein
VIPPDELELVFGSADAVQIEPLDASEGATRGVWRVRCGDGSAVLKVAS